MALLTAKDFPRWTRARLGLPTDANLSEEIDRVILRSEDHVRSLLGKEVFDGLAEHSSDNAERRRRFEAAVHSLVESQLHEMHGEHLATQVGSSTQGKRSRTVAVQARDGAKTASIRAYSHFVEGMFHLGYTVRAEARNIHYTSVSR